MEQEGWLLGIDTSNYTTSLAIVDGHGRIIDDKRMLLPVPVNERGLRQAEACFAHQKQLPDLFRSLTLPVTKPLAIAVSVQPRAIEGSYMPVFTIGSGYAKVLSKAYNCPILKLSHQEGHIQAGLRSAGGPEGMEFLVLHLSGGTTELLLVKREGYSFSETILGGSNDLQIGQFVDRIGVKLGLQFPAGPELELLARTHNDEHSLPSIPTYCRELEVSFSGSESHALRLIDQGLDKASIARAVEKAIARVIEKLLRNAIQQTQADQVLLVGGVSSNLYIRQQLKRRLQPIMDLWFADPTLSSDNAVGVAWHGLSMLNHQLFYESEG